MKIYGAAALLLLVGGLAFLLLLYSKRKQKLMEEFTPPSASAPESPIATQAQNSSVIERKLDDATRLLSPICKMGESEYIAVGWSETTTRLLVAGFCTERLNALSETDTQRVLGRVGYPNLGQKKTSFEAFRASKLVYLLSRRTPGFDRVSFWDNGLEYIVLEPVVLALCQECENNDRAEELTKLFRRAEESSVIRRRTLSPTSREDEEVSPPPPRRKVNPAPFEARIYH